MMRFPTVVGERDLVVKAGRVSLVMALVGALLGLVVAAGWYSTRPVQYSSTISLELTPVAPLVDLNPKLQKLPEVTVDTDAVIAVSDPVVSAVAAAAGDDEVSARSELTVRARTLSRVLELTYTTEESAEAAREGVTAAAEAFLDLREQLMIDPARGYLGSIVAGTDKTQQALLGQSDNLSRGQAAMEARLERAQAYTAAMPKPGLVLQSATLPTARRGTVDVTVVSGAFLGALLGFVVGLAVERHRRRRLTRARMPAGREDPATTETSSSAELVDA